MIRKTFATTLLVFLLVAVVLFNGWNLFKIHDGLKTLLVSSIRSIAGDQCTVDNISFGIGSLNLNGVNLVFKDSPYILQIERLQLGYSFKSLFSGGINPEKKADEITIYKPKLILRYTPSPSGKPNLDMSLRLSEDQEKFYRALLKEYDFIERMTISDGEIFVLNTKTSAVRRVAQKISGWAYCDESNKIWLRMAGHVFNSDEINTILYGQLNLTKGGVEYINVELHDYQLGKEPSYFVPAYIGDLQGTINGSLTITEKLSPERGVDINGPISLRNGKLKLNSENLFFDDINIDAEIKDWDLEIKKASQRVNGSPITIEGTIVNIAHPQFNVKLKSSQFNIDSFLSQYLPEKRYPFSGLADIDFSVKGAFDNPIIQGFVRCDSVGFFNKRLRHVSVGCEFSNRQLSFNRIGGNYGSARFSGGGQIDFLSPDKIVDFDIDLSGDFTNDLTRLGFSSVNECDGNAEIKIFGSLLNPVSTGEYNLVFTPEFEEVQAISGSYKYSHGTFVVNANSPDNDFSLSASVDSLFDTPQISIDATNIEKTFGFIDDPRLNYLKQHYHFNLSLEGELSQPHVVLDGYRIDNYEKLLHVDVQPSLSKKSELFAGKIDLFPNTKQHEQGEIYLTKNTQNKWETHVNLGDWLQGKLMHDKTDNHLKGELFISGMDVGVVFALMDKKPGGYGGDVYGQIKLNGTAQEPEYSGELWVIDGFVSQKGPYKADFAFHSNTDTFRIDKLIVVNSDNLDLTMNGFYNFHTKEIDLEIAGKHVKVENIIKIFSEKEGVASGDAFIQVHLKGMLPKIPIYGSITVQHPQILSMKFDRVLFEFGDSSHSNGSYISSDELHFKQATLTKEGQFSLNGSAVLPLQETNPMNVKMSGDGNFLALLPDLSELFENTDSDGHLDLNLAGYYMAPDFSGSAFHFKNGVVHLSSVAREIDNIEGSCVIRANDYFLDLQYLNATIQGRWISMTNTNDLVGLDHGIYEPLRIAGDNLNLGAIMIKTDPGGVSLHIPGLMEKGDRGWFALSGKQQGEEFFLSGPWERPKVRGQIHIRHANLMFPFNESEGKGNPVVMNILDNIDWDIDAYSSKDTRYVRQFPAGVYVNMEVDKKNSHLGFTGVLKDSTFGIQGKVESTRGEIEYLDLNFRVEKVGAEFNQTSFFPEVYGKAWTVIRDSTNIPNDVYLELYTMDKVTHQEVNKGRWDRINIKLSSEYPGYQETQEDLMATLGYSTETIDNQAVKAVGSRTDNLILRPLFRPVERELERNLGLDVVRFSYAITQNFLNSSFTNDALGSSLAFLKSSRLILGKYLTDDIYFLYTGELEAGIDYQFQDKGVGLRHIVGLEYRLNASWLLQMEYDYNTLLESHKDDKKISLRHSFPF